MKRLFVTTTLVALAALLPEAAWACESCFGVADGETGHAITVAMTALIVMTGVIWGGIGAFVVNMRRRARRLEPGNLVVTAYGEIQERPDDAPPAS